MKKLKKYIPYLLLFSYLILIFISPPKYINYPKLLLIKIIRFPLKLSDAVFYNIRYLSQSKVIVEENKDLSKEINELKSKLTELESLKDENRRFKKILAFKDKIPFKFIACSVIAKDSTSLSESIVIGAGSTQGIKEGTVVVSTSGVVGRIIENSHDVSRVLLITDPNSRISAISSRSRGEGMLHGISDGLCRMIYLPLDCDIKKNDTIITSGFSSHYPKGLILGTVVEVSKSPDALSLNAIVKPEFDLTRLEEVLCIK